MNYPRLRDLREDKDLTQEYIAKLINISVRQYGLYERGKADIPLEKAVILAKFYNVSLDYIAGLTNDKLGLTRSALSNTETKLIKKFNALSENGKARILERFDVIEEQEKIIK